MNFTRTKQNNQYNAIYIDSNLILIKRDKNLILKLHVKTHVVFHNFIQPIPNHMGYEKQKE